MEGAKYVDQLEEIGTYSELSTRVTAFSLLEDLLQGKTDVALHDSLILEYLVKDLPEYNINIKPYEDESVASSQLVMLMAKDNTDLINNVNEGITTLKSEGIFDDIKERWLSDSEQASNTQSAN